MTEDAITIRTDEGEKYEAKLEHIELESKTGSRIGNTSVESGCHYTADVSRMVKVEDGSGTNAQESEEAVQKLEDDVGPLSRNIRAIIKGLITVLDQRYKQR